MKNILLASTMLVGFASVAMAEVTLTGSGRFGVLYEESDDADVTETTVSTRLRFNINASTETSSGLTLGGRIRLQYDNGDIAGDTGAGAELSAAKLFAEMGPFRMEVANVDTAYDSAALMYNSEIGFIGRSFGNPGGSFYSFSSGPYDSSEADRMGIYFAYGIESFNVRLSYVSPDQDNGGGSVATVGDINEEIGISADYDFGQIIVSAAAVMDGNGIDGNDQYFVGAEYALNGTANIGLLYFDNGEIADVDVGNTITLYGNYGIGATTLRAYIANNDNDANENDIAIGLGADYDLGGATLAGGIAQGFDENLTADLGVKFDF
jgi:outer membrane protein OmpU